MDEEAEGPKTCKLDEVLRRFSLRGVPYPSLPLAMTKSRSIATGGRDWIENPTRFKLKETKYFLDKVSQAYVVYIRETTDENRDELLFNLSAFLAAGRGILQRYIPKQYGIKWDTKLGYKLHPELKFFTKIRDEFVHEKPHAIVAERGLQVPVTARVVYANGDPRKLTAPPLPEIQPQEPIASEPVTYEVVIRPDDETKNKLGLADEYNLLAFCNGQYKRFEELVKKCEEQFRKP